MSVFIVVRPHYSIIIRSNPKNKRMDYSCKLLICMGKPEKCEVVDFSSLISGCRLKNI